MATGDFGAILHEKELVTGINGLARTSCAHAIGNISCVVYGSVPTSNIQIIIATFSVNSSTGIVSDVLDSVTILNIGATNSAGHVVKIRDGLVAVAVNNQTAMEIQVYTYSIASDGSITLVDSLTSSLITISQHRPTPVRVTDTLMAVAYNDQNADKNEVITIDIDSSGNLGSIQDTQTMGETSGTNPQQDVTVGLAKVRDPDIWAMGEHLPTSNGDSQAMTFTINEATGAISAPIDTEVFNSNAVNCDQIIPFLPSEVDGQFVINVTNNTAGNRFKHLVSYQVDSAADLGVDLATEVIATGGGTSHGSAAIYLGDRVVLHQLGGSAGKESFNVSAGGLFTSQDIDSAGAQTPVWSYLMHPPGFGNRMVMSYAFGGGDPHIIYISTFEIENQIDEGLTAQVRMCVNYTPRFGGTAVDLRFDFKIKEWREKIETNALALNTPDLENEPLALNYAKMTIVVKGIAGRLHAVHPPGIGHDPDIIDLEEVAILWNRGAPRTMVTLTLPLVSGNREYRGMITNMVIVENPGTELVDFILTFGVAWNTGVPLFRGWV